MKNVLATTLIIGGLFFLFTPSPAKAAAVSWDGNFAQQVLQPLQSYWSSVIRGSFFQATSTTATSSFPVASTTKFCISNDCRFAWPSSGGTSAVATSSQETATYVPFYTSTNGTPAEISGGESTFTYNATDNRLTISYASTTGISSSYASSTSGFFGSLSVGALTGILKATAGLVSVATPGTDYLVNAITSIGPAGQTQSGPSVAVSTTTSSFNGLTVGTTVVGAGNTLTWTPSLSGTLNNSGLTNSTISGISLGSNLGDLTAGNSSLTFSGTYNGSTARNIILNMGNANNWTALQTFVNASSTLFSVTNTAYFGGTATTTISSIGSITMPAGSVFTKTGTADGCANWSSGVLGTTGVACGSGGASTDKWATSTSPTFGIYPNSALTVGFGTSSPRWTIQAASSTNAQLALSDGTVTGEHFLFRNAGNSLTIATASPTTLATTSNSNIFNLNRNGALCIGIGCSPITTAGLVVRDQEGTGPLLFLGGNAGGDTDWQSLRRYANNDTLNNDRLSLGTGSITAGVADAQSEIMTWLPTGLTGIGSTTPWAQLGVASSTWSDYTRPLLAVATSSNSAGHLLSIFSTTTEISLASPAFFLENIISGVRLGIGTITQYGFGGLLDHIFGNIRINTGNVANYQCYGGSSGGVSLAADTAGACGDFALQEDGTITGSNSNIALGVQGFRIQIAGATSPNSGGALTLTRDFSAATNTPIMEGSIVRGSGSSLLATSTVYFGFTNTSPSGSSFETPPTAGCYFTASTTQNNWIATCHSGASTYAGFVNTNIATTTSNFTRFRIEMTNSEARFYTQSAGSNLTKIATMSGANYPSTPVLVPWTMVADDATGGITSNLDINYLRVWSTFALQIGI